MKHTHDGTVSAVMRLAEDYAATKSESDACGNVASLENKASTARKRLESAVREALPGWFPIESVPKDGSEFVAAYGNQQFVTQLARWCSLRGQWESKGSPQPGFASNATHWSPLPPTSDVLEVARVNLTASLADAQAEIARLRGALKVCQQALAKIHEAESETFDDDLQQNVQVAMDDEEMIEIARQALESTL